MSGWDRDCFWFRFLELFHWTKGKKLKFCTITAAQGLDQKESNLLKGYHSVRLSNFMEIPPHNCISSITPKQTRFFFSITYPDLFSLWRGTDHQDHHKEKATGLSPLLEVQWLQLTEVLWYKATVRKNVEISATFAAKSSYYNCFLLALMDGWLSEEHSPMPFQNKLF